MAKSSARIPGLVAAVALAFPASASPMAPSVVTLITGDRVALSWLDDGRPVVAVDPASASGSAGFQTLTIGGHVYVVPLAAAGSIGSPLDLGLFDVTALAAQGSGPLALDVTADAGASVPSISITSAGHGVQARGNAAQLGQALSADWKARKQGKAGTGLFAGVQRIALAGSVPNGQPAGKLYTLTVKGFDQNGQKVFGNFGVVYNVDDGNTFIAAQSFFDGTFSFSVPAGNYQVSALITTITGAQASFALLTTEATVKSSSVVVLQARKSNPVGVTVPDPSATAVASLTLQRDPVTGPGFTNGFTTFGPTAMYVSPEDPVTVGQQYFYPFFRLGDASGSLDHYVYDLQFNYVGGIPSNLWPVVSRADLARFDAEYHSSVPGRAQLEGRLALAPWQAGAGFSLTPLAAPRIRTEYVLPQPDTQWLQMVVADAQSFDGFTSDSFRAPAAGDRAATRWLAQPEPPGIEQDVGAVQPCPACRAGDTLSIQLFPFVDTSGNRMVGDADIATDLSLYEYDTFLGRYVLLDPPQHASQAQFALDPAPATYQLAMDLSRDAPWWPTSARTHTVWTFKSAERAPDALPAGWTCGGKGGGGGGGGKGSAPTSGKGGGGGGDGCSFEALLFATYDTHAGVDDVIPAGSAAVVDVAVSRQAFGPGSTIESFTFDVSFDDGASWTPATVSALGGGRFRASYAQPSLDATTGFASFRIDATDDGESALHQEIVRAYPLSVLPPAGTGGGGGKGTPSFRPCTTQVMAPYAQCMALMQPARGDPPPPPPTGYGPADLASAYNLPAGAGAGKVVAIVDAYDDPNAESDLAVYRDKYKLPPCTTANGCFRKVNQLGAAGPLPRPDVGWGVEISLDLDAVSATCPDCRILLVEANDSSIFNLGTGVNTAVALGADAVSNSYGSRGEFSGEELFESFYKHSGVAITVSSGDYGYGNGLPLTGGVSYPGASQFVTAVGGTTLVKDGSARGWTETAWAGSTSGCSAYIHKPGWQKDRLCDKRTVADVAAVADPQTGLAVYDTFFPEGSKLAGWLVVGGTSLSSPIVASIYAMSGHTSQVRYGVDPYRSAASFFDVIGGSSGVCGGTYLCTAVPGYDAPTGLGTPNGVGGF